MSEKLKSNQEPDPSREGRLEAREKALLFSPAVPGSQRVKEGSDWTVSVSLESSAWSQLGEEGLACRAG